MIINRDIDIKVFVINLKRCADRKTHMVKQLNQLNIVHEFVDTVDGQGLSDREINTKYGVETFPPWSSFNARHLLKGEIGCLLSHLSIYQRMIHEDIECACIFEDDNDFGQDVDILLKENLLLKIDWELLLIGHSGRSNNPLRGAEHSSKREHVFGLYHIAKPVEVPFGTYAYLIKKSAAQKLLQRAYPLRMPMDLFTGHAAAAGVEIRILTPPCTTHNTTLFESTIYDPDQNSHLYFNRMRRIRRHLGEKYPILRILRRKCLAFYQFPLLQIRKLGLLEESYADKRLFLKQRSPWGTSST
jgi:glycosyl transferase family 25